MEKNTDLSLGKNAQRMGKIGQNLKIFQQERTFRTEEDDLQILEKQLSLIRAMAQLSSSGLTVFDQRKQLHVYTSQNFYKIFGYDIKNIDRVENHIFDKKVHPDDLKQLVVNGFAVMKFLSQISPKKRKQYKMINEYRISPSAGKYIHVVEQHQVLELDFSGNVWLSLGVIDVSPDQSGKNGVKFQILNFVTGEFVQLEPECRVKTVHLTIREREILRLVKDGKLSKEISNLLEISIHTVNTHRQRILEKLEANNAIEAVSVAEKLHLLQ